MPQEIKIVGLRRAPAEMVGDIKFHKPKERLAVARRDQGLRGKKVFVKGKQADLKKRGFDKSIIGIDLLAEARKKSSYPDLKEKRTDLDYSLLASGQQLKEKEPRSKGETAEETHKPAHDGPGRFRRRSMLLGKGGGVRPDTTLPAPKKLDDSVSSDSELSSPSVSSDSLSSDSDSDSDTGESLLSSSSSSSMSSTKKRVPLDPSMKGMLGKDKGKGLFGNMTKEEAEAAEKNDLLHRFHYLRQRGVHVSKNFTEKSNLNEMRMEMGRIEHEEQVERAIRINRRWALASAALVQDVTDNSRMPTLIRGKFNGFNRYLLQNIEEFDSAFERLSERYGGVIGAITGGNPLYEIVSLFAYHLVMYYLFYRGSETAKANEQLNEEDIKRRYPHLIQNAVKEEMLKRYESELERRRKDFLEYQDHANRTINHEGLRYQREAPRPSYTDTPAFAPPKSNVVPPVFEPEEYLKVYGTSTRTQYANPAPPSFLNMERPAPERDPGSDPRPGGSPLPGLPSSSAENIASLRPDVMLEDNFAPLPHVPLHTEEESLRFLQPDMQDDFQDEGLDSLYPEYAKSTRPMGPPTVAGGPVPSRERLPSPIKSSRYVEKPEEIRDDEEVIIDID